MKGKGKGKGKGKAKPKSKSNKSMEKSENNEITINTETQSRKDTPTAKTGEPTIRYQPETSLEFTCDKCGTIFATEYELDHHDKTDH
jgi:DNA-directed RNA polymerase subunit M/transcription elongation factor TFIIS